MGRLASVPARAWLQLVTFSLVFFLTTAATFSSLGVVLPAMVAELHWSWGQAGLGFTLLGGFTGGSQGRLRSTRRAPRRAGVRSRAARDA